MYNFFSNLKNNNIILKNKILIKLSKKNLNYLNLLLNTGFIRGYKIVNNKIEVLLKYINNKPLINKIKIISKPSCRVYINKKQKLNNNGLYIISTSKGLLTNKQIKEYNLGGELICHIC